MHYLLMSAHETYPSVELRTHLERLEWVTGATIHPPSVLEFEMQTDTAFSWPDFIRPNSVIPLFSQQMRDVLESVSVTNIDYIPAYVRNIGTNETRQYWAANIIGLISAMDREKSDFLPFPSNPELVFTIDRLVLNHSSISSAGDPDIFRLAEYDLLVVISERLASALSMASLNSLRILNSEDWDGFAD